VYLLIGVYAFLQGRSRGLFIVSSANGSLRFRALGLARETMSCHIVSIVKGKGKAVPLHAMEALGG
jgi:hypothetical protein